ncbi:MAG: M24 family metallopeptidase [Pseudomonadota bacterium]
MFPLEKVQKAIQAERLDGWLFYDFQGLDPTSRRIVEIPESNFLTRRWYYFVPKEGSPRKLMHKIEPNSLEHLPGESHFFAAWKELDAGLKKILGSAKTVAMNYSPRNAIPYCSRVDAGTVELVTSMGVRVHPAADLIQQFESAWSDEQLQTHIRAAKVLRTIVDETFRHVAQEIRKGSKLTEYDVQEFIWNRFSSNHLVSDSRPIAAVGPNSGNPHYGPTKEIHLPVRKGDFLLLDIWAKEGTEKAVYADITWTGVVDETVPDKYEQIFQIVRGARDASLRLVEESVRAGRKLIGADVDDAARNHISKSGYGEYFIHRTGHNIGADVHGNGAHMDNYETREERKVIPHTCFSIEPGIYMKEFGVRTEIDVYVGETDVMVYGQPIQTTVIPILKNY